MVIPVIAIELPAMSPGWSCCWSWMSGCLYRARFQAMSSDWRKLSPLALLLCSSFRQKWFRMSKSNLQARPIYHCKRDSIEAHFRIVFAKLAVSRWIEDRTGWSIRMSVRTTRANQF